MTGYRITVASNGNDPHVEVTADQIGDGGMWEVTVEVRAREAAEGRCIALPDVGPIAPDEMARLATFTLTEFLR